MIAVALSLNLLNLGQNIAQLGVIESATPGAPAVNTKRSGAGDEGSDDSERDHCDMMMEQ